MREQRALQRGDVAINSVDSSWNRQPSVPDGFVINFSVRLIGEKCVIDPV